MRQGFLKRLCVLKNIEGELRMSNSFTALLRGARKRRGLSQTELANKTGLQPSAVAHFEGGRRKPSFDNIIVLANALSVSSDYLLGISKGITSFAGEIYLSDTDRDYVQEIINMMNKKRRMKDE
jgi:transcriptional regulator with XRE-family HTH domain